MPSLPSTGQDCVSPSSCRRTNTVDRSGSHRCRRLRHRAYMLGGVHRGAVGRGNLIATQSLTVVHEGPGALGESPAEWIAALVVVRG